MLPAGPHDDPWQGYSTQEGVAAHDRRSALVGIPLHDYDMDQPLCYAAFETQPSGRLHKVGRLPGMQNRNNGLSFWKHHSMFVDFRNITVCLLLPFEANQMAEFCCHLCYIAWLRGVDFIFEQPSSSLLYTLDCCKVLTMLTKAVLQWTSLGGFGGPIAKPTMFLGTAPWLWRLYRETPKLLAGDKGEYYHISIKADGTKQVTGTKKLKSSEHYPTIFCEFLLQTWKTTSSATTRRGARARQRTFGHVRGDNSLPGCGPSMWYLGKLGWLWCYSYMCCGGLRSRWWVRPGCMVGQLTCYM